MTPGRSRLLTSCYVIACCLVAACNRAAPEAAASGHPSATSATTIKAAPDAALASASLAGVTRDADPPSVDPAGAGPYRLPGEFEAGTTESRLKQRFGADNVRITDVPGGEGESSRGIVLFPADPARRATLYFQDARHLRGLRMVRVTDPGSRWRLDNGIGVGTPLAKLVAINAAPIQFSGFDWDYGGAISDWNGGHLQPRDGHGPTPVIRLDHGDVAAGTYPVGDATFSSDDTHYPRLGETVFVGEIGISFPTADP